MNMQNDSVKKSMGWGKLDEAWSQFVSLKKMANSLKPFLKEKHYFEFKQRKSLKGYSSEMYYFIEW